MRAAVVEKPGVIRVWDVEAPVIDEYEALLEMAACGICNATDAKILAGHLREVPEYPAILGHEGVGRVVKVGDKVRTFKVGDWVSDGYAKPRAPGLHSAWGGFAEYAVVKDAHALAEAGQDPPDWMWRQQVIPGDVDPVEATILCTLKEAASGLANFGLQQGATLMVHGDGPVGCALTRFAVLAGCEVVGVGHWDERLARMKELGARHVVNAKREDLADALGRILGPERVDLAIDAVGSGPVVAAALPWIKGGGKLGMYGVNAADSLSLDLTAWPNHVSVHKLFFPERHDRMHQAVLDHVRSGAVRLKDFYSHILPLEEIATGFELIGRREAFKVIVRIGEE